MHDARLVLFDLDGTVLVAGDPLHRAAMEGAFVDVLGVAATLDGVPLAGMLDRQIARAALAAAGVDGAPVDDAIDALMLAVGDRYRTALGGDSRVDHVLPGVGALVDALGARGHRCAVLTGNARGVARARLVAAGLGATLVDGAYGCEADDRAVLVDAARARHLLGGSPWPAERTVIVGDTPRDIDAARRAGVRAVAVATGHFDIDALRAHGPDAVLADLGDTAAALAAITA